MENQPASLTDLAKLIQSDLLSLHTHLCALRAYSGERTPEASRALFRVRSTAEVLFPGSVIASTIRQSCQR